MDSPESAMDLANNRLGLSVAANLQKEGKLTKEKLVEGALDSLKSKRLVVLRPRGGAVK